MVDFLRLPEPSAGCNNNSLDRSDSGCSSLYLNVCSGSTVPFFWNKSVTGTFAWFKYVRTTSQWASSARFLCAICARLPRYARTLQCTWNLLNQNHATFGAVMCEIWSHFQLSAGSNPDLFSFNCISPNASFIDFAPPLRLTRWKTKTNGDLDTRLLPCLMTLACV